jgi:hypothetical protein
MARTLEEAKRYVVSLLRKYTEETYPGRMTNVVFFRSPYEDMHTVAASWVPKVPSGLIRYYVNEEWVRSNIYNIENPAVEDLIIHEVAHTHESLDTIRKRAKSASDPHRAKAYREWYKQHASEMGIIGPFLLPPIKKTHLYTGPSASGDIEYGIVPSDAYGTLMKCMDCGHVDIFDPQKRERKGGFTKATCPRCRGERNIAIKRVSPREVLNYQVASQSRGPTEMQEWMRRKYGNYTEKIPVAPHKVRRKQMKARAKPKIARNPNILKNLKRFI